MRFKMAYLHFPRKTGIKRCLAPPPLKIAEARKSACASSPRVSLRQREDQVAVAVARTPHRSELRERVVR